MLALRCLVSVMSVNVAMVIMDPLLSSSESMDIAPMNDLVVKLPLRDPFTGHVVLASAFS